MIIFYYFSLNFCFKFLTSWNCQLRRISTYLLFFWNFHYLISYSLVFHLHSSHSWQRNSFFHVFFYFKMVANLSWLISMSISVWDTRVLMLSSLLLASIRILLWFFFLFLAMLSNFLIISVVSGKIKLKLGLSIPTGALTTLVLHQLLCLKQLKSCLCNQRL